MSDIRDRGQLCAIKGAAPCILTMEGGPGDFSSGFRLVSTSATHSERTMTCVASEQSS